MQSKQINCNLVYYLYLKSNTVLWICDKNIFSVELKKLSLQQGVSEKHL